MKFLLLIFKNIGRNPLRSALTALGTMVLVFVVTLVWSVLWFLDLITTEQSRDFKAIVTERWRIPSQMPYSYATTLGEGAARRPGDVRPLDSMTWQFYGGTLDPGKLTRENIVFAVALEPSKVRTMMDELDKLPPAEAADLDQAVRRLSTNQQGLIIGLERLEAINKRVGERIKIHSLNFKGIDLELEIVGTFPRGRYDNSAAMHRDYLNQALDAYARNSPGRVPHPMAERSLNLVWLRMADEAMFTRVAGQIMSSPLYANPAVKCETASSGSASFLEAFRDLIWGMRWLLAPAALATLSLVIANSISIGVRQRRTELAVLKVLGFRPLEILMLVLGEALLIGTLSGLLSTGLTFAVVNYWLGGIKFPMAMWGSFFIPPAALAWGPAIGATTALVGSLVPAWSAGKVKVAEVFAKVA